jgi:hypothetical protein
MRDFRGGDFDMAGLRQHTGDIRVSSAHGSVDTRREVEALIDELARARAVCL